jgi:uncharacterized protein
MNAQTWLLMLSLALASLGCSDDAGGGGDVDAAAQDVHLDTQDVGDADGVDALGEAVEDVGVDTAPYVEPRESSSFKTREVVHQLYVWDTEPGTAVEVVGPSGDVVAQGLTDEQGAVVFRELTPGGGYMVRLTDDPDDYTGPLGVMSVESSLPDEAFYADQVLEPGFGYLTTRDGTTLSVFVSLPGPPEDGPYPTLVNYSGYTPSRPGQSMGPPGDVFCGKYPVLCDAPNFPSGVIGGVMGFATVGVNVRGTACSGGAYDYFDMPQKLDGYDVIEIVARQPWVKHHKVGMVGLSFPGITQLFVAAERPPSLAAIAPMSVIGDTGSSTLLPGGIYNIGFALEWIGMVLNNAEPYDHGWVRDLIEAGDTICDENQKLHGQKLDAVSKAFENPFYSDDVAKPVDPSSFVHKIEVPVFLVGQWQDEQTGPHFPILADQFTSSPLFRMTATNGVHPDGFSPQVLAEWYNFLSFYVAREIPDLPNEMGMMVPIFMEQVYGAPLDIPPERFEDYTDYEMARADYEAEPPIHIIFESGAPADVAPGAPEGTFAAHFDAWPLPETAATRWYLHPDGALRPDLPPEEGGFSSFEPDPEAGDRELLNSGSVNPLQPDWSYRQPIDGKALSYITDPLTEDLVMIGHGSLDLWLRTSADDADLEVCLTEVRPDGRESYIQCGWQRASYRKLRDDATELRPIKSNYEEDVEPVIPGEWTELRVELMPFVHIFRADSRLRIVIDTPGDSMARWNFMLLDFGDELPTQDVSHAAAQPSSIALPVIPGVDVPTPLPPCEALRGQPCRDYVDFENLTAL